LDKELLLRSGYITKEDIDLIDLALEGNSYPKSYSPEYIEKEHERISKLPIQLNLF
jgi:hypothetical protein